QHTRNVLAAGQKLAGRDRLDGLAEAHLVGEQRALSEREMQHALTLVWQERMMQHVEAGGAVLDLGEEGGAGGFARALPAMAIEAADLHLVEAAASGLRPEGSEKRMFRLERLDGDDLGRAPPATQCELVLVAGPPALQRRPVEHGAGLAGRTGGDRFLLTSRI